MSAKPHEEVDHIDGNTLNDDPSNLRLCTHKQNSANKKVSGKGTSQYKGVSWHKPTQKWQVRVAGRCVGYFSNEVEAALVYNKEATKVFGEFARLNPVEFSNASQVG